MKITSNLVLAYTFYSNIMPFTTSFFTDNLAAIQMKKERNRKQYYIVLLNMIIYGRKYHHLTTLGTWYFAV